MTLNSERVGVEECVTLIRNYLEIKGLYNFHDEREELI